MNKVMLITGATSDLAIELLNNIKNEDITILYLCIVISII